MASRRSDVRLLAHWVRARVLITIRSPRAAFFTFVFPLVLLTLLDLTSGDSRVSVPGGKVAFAQYFSASIGIYGLTVGCYAMPILGLATARELGVLKRVRGTPLSPAVYLGSWLVAAMLTGLASITAMLVIAVPAFGVDIRVSLLPAAIATAVLSAAALGSLGLAVSTAVRRADAAPAVANLTLFPLSFLSGVFFPLQGAPQWVVRVAHVFPLSHIVEAFTACFSPYTTGSGFELRDLGVIAAWGIGGLVVAVRRFRTETEVREGATRGLLRTARSG